MASSHHADMESAKFLEKIIQDLKDEPVKLASKLYMISQHMKLNGKEQSLAYQVISRALETVVSQHGLDVNSLKLPHLPLAGGAQMGDSGHGRSDKDAHEYSSSLTSIDVPHKGGPVAWNATSSSNTIEDDHGRLKQSIGVLEDSKVTSVQKNKTNHGSSISDMPIAGPFIMESMDHSVNQRSSSHKNAESSEHESLVNLGMDDSRATNSQEQHNETELGKQVQQKDNRKASVKRKKAEPYVVIHPDNFQKTNTPITRFGAKKGKLMQERNPGSLEGPGDQTIVSRHPNRDADVSSANSVVGLQKGGSVPSKNGAGYQAKVGSSSGADVESTTSTSMRQLANHGSMSNLRIDSLSIFQGSGAAGPLSNGNISGKCETASGADQDSIGKPRLDAVQKDVRANSSGNMEMIPQGAATPTDMGRSSASHVSGSSGLLFKAHQLIQLKAQCLVFLAFKNNMPPSQENLKFALGESYTKEDGNRGMNEHGREISLKESGDGHATTGFSGRPNDISTDKEIVNNLPASSSGGNLAVADAPSKSKETAKKPKGKKGPASEGKRLASAKSKHEEGTHETAASPAFSSKAVEPDSFSSGGTASESHYEKDDCQQVGLGIQAGSSILGTGKQLESGISCSIGFPNDSIKGTFAPAIPAHEHLPSKVDNSFSCLQYAKESEKLKAQITPARRDAEHGYLKHMMTFPRDANSFSANVAYREHFSSASGFTNSNGSANAVGPDGQKVSDIQRNGDFDGFKAITSGDPVKYSNPLTGSDRSADQEGGHMSVSSDVPTSASKYTTSEKWVMQHIRRKVREDEIWALKQRKTESRIAARFDKLKENVSSCEDISVRTRSVIELKKLQLLRLQRRLRSDFLHDFFKPIATDMERLKSIKKNRYGRRIKQLERLEQKMKEERQKRVRERQKEFFSEIETHKEKMEDYFKIKRERWKGVNRFVKEFHKRKERSHREKIDRIQREKINLLKNNDVEGYLRMVQDAKSDRVKQLLKETEKYLQQLGAKVLESKTMTRRFEMEMDGNRSVNAEEKVEFLVDNEDGNDQAQHYMANNEKYYQMAHSVKETIDEQPSFLQGGKLREYQMNGLRWLVSLYNNNLNGILADEMGLGKTVQVISLICYLMEAKNDRGPFVVVVPSSVLPGWDAEIARWAPSIDRVTYAGPPEERRRLFRERIAHQKFNLLLTTYEYLMNKNDRQRLSKIHWHYLIIDEGHRIKNASCKLNADLKHYQSFHRLLLTGTPLQNNLEELWVLLNFLLPNIFKSSEDFSQWFNKPFENSGDSSPDAALLSEEENLLIINRLHQVLRPFVLRRLKHKVANELPGKIERLIRCEASAYQKLLMKRVEDNLGSMGASKGRAVHNSVMELRNICNHPYLSQLHAEEVNNLIPKHYLPSIVRLCGKLEMLDRLLPKLKATDHRVLLFSTMTRLLDIMEEYLSWKDYKYLRLDGHTAGNERGALIEEFNRPDSPSFIFLLSIRAGGVGVNLQAADTVIIFDTDWNPQVDLQAQARAHRIGQKKDVLVLRLETVGSVEEQVRASAEQKLGLANQSITAGFFDNNTSAEDRREYLESLFRECKKEESTRVLDDDAINELIARSGSEIDIFESIDKQRHDKEVEAWKNLIGRSMDCSEPHPPIPSRLVTENDLEAFYKAMQIHEASQVAAKRKNESLGGLDVQQYGRGKRTREVRSYEDQWTEEEFEKLCQVDSPESSEAKNTKDSNIGTDTDRSKVIDKEVQPPLPAASPSSKEVPLPVSTEPLPQPKHIPPSSSTESSSQLQELPQPSNEPQQPLQKAQLLSTELHPPSKEPKESSKEKSQPPKGTATPPEAATPSKRPLPRSSKVILPASKDLQQPTNKATPPAKRGRGRPRRATADASQSPSNVPVTSASPSIVPVASTSPTMVPVVSASPTILPIASANVSTTEMGPQIQDYPVYIMVPIADASLYMQGLGGNPQHQLAVGTAAPGSLATLVPAMPMPSHIRLQNQMPNPAPEKPRRRGAKKKSNAPAGVPESNLVSNVPVIHMAADKPSSSSNQSKGMLLTSSGIPVHVFAQNEVHSISGLQIPVQAAGPSLALSRDKDMPSVQDEKQTAVKAPLSDATASAVESSDFDSKKVDAVKIGLMQARDEHKVGEPLSATSPLAQESTQRMHLPAGSADKKTEQRQISTEKAELSCTQSSQKILLVDSSQGKTFIAEDARGTKLELKEVNPVEVVNNQPLSDSPDKNSQREAGTVVPSLPQMIFCGGASKSNAPLAARRASRRKASLSAQAEPARPAAASGHSHMMESKEQQRNNGFQSQSAMTDLGGQLPENQHSEISSEMEPNTVKPAHSTRESVASSASNDYSHSDAVSFKSKEGATLGSKVCCSETPEPPQAEGKGSAVVAVSSRFPIEVPSATHNQVVGSSTDAVIPVLVLNLSETKNAGASTDHCDIHDESRSSTTYIQETTDLPEHLQSELPSFSQTETSIGSLKTGKQEGQCVKKSAVGRCNDTESCILEERTSVKAIDMEPKDASFVQSVGLVSPISLMHDVHDVGSKANVVDSCEVEPAPIVCTLGASIDANRNSEETLNTKGNSGKELVSSDASLGKGTVTPVTTKINAGASVKYVSEEHPLRSRLIDGNDGPTCVKDALSCNEKQEEPAKVVLTSVGTYGSTDPTPKSDRYTESNEKQSDLNRESNDQKDEIPSHQQDAGDCVDTPCGSDAKLNHNVLVLSQNEHELDGPNYSAVNEVVGPGLSSSSSSFEVCENDSTPGKCLPDAAPVDLEEMANSNSTNQSRVILLPVGVPNQETNSDSGIFGVTDSTDIRKDVCGLEPSASPKKADDGKYLSCITSVAPSCENAQQDDRELPVVAVNQDNKSDSGIVLATDSADITKDGGGLEPSADPKRADYHRDLPCIASAPSCENAQQDDH